MKRINYKPTKRFEKAWGLKAIELERELAPECWLLLGMRERSCYYPLRCYARGASRAEVESLAQLAALMAERANKKFELIDNPMADWTYVIYPPLRDHHGGHEPQPQPFEPATAQ
jgi:hypothetical protein